MIEASRTKKSKITPGSAYMRLVNFGKFLKSVVADAYGRRCGCDGNRGNSDGESSRPITMTSSYVREIPSTGVNRS